MSVNNRKRNERKVYGPEIILCEQCEGHGTLIVQAEAKDYYDRSIELCETCQETGLKGIPESEVNKVRR